MTFECRGELLELLPEKAIYWPAREMLLVADLHIGKAATFRAFGAPVPESPTYETLARLTALVEAKKARSLAILGDLFHAREATQGAPRQAFLDWLATHSTLEIKLVVGNHDRRAMSALAEFGEWADAVEETPFRMAHHPSEHELYTLCGHIHPGYRLVAPGYRSECLPCFWFGKHYAVLPAFGSFTGLGRIEPSEGDGVYLIANSEVIRVQV